jgi:hypothetical protein
MTPKRELHEPLACPHCEDGLVYKSRYGGNDPDVYFDGCCEECDGKGNMQCEVCLAVATHMLGGNALCAKHYDETVAEWE